MTAEGHKRSSWDQGGHGLLQTYMLKGAPKNPDSSSLAAIENHTVEIRHAESLSKDFCLLILPRVPPSFTKKHTFFLKACLAHSLHCVWPAQKLDVGQTVLPAPRPIPLPVPHLPPQD